MAVTEAGSTEPARSWGGVGEGIAIAFRVHKDLESDPNEGEISIWNLPREERAWLRGRGRRVLLFAGWEDSAPLAFVGDVERAEERREDDGSIVTVLHAADGAAWFGSSHTSLTVPPGATREQAIEMALGASREVGLRFLRGEEVGADDVTAHLEQYRQGATIHAPTRDVVRRIATAMRYEWSVQNETVQLVPRRRGNGMSTVRFSSLTTEPPEYLEARDEGGVPGWRIRSPLVADVVPGQPVQLGYDEIPESYWRVRSHEMTGDSEGDAWDSVLEVEELTP